LGWGVWWGVGGFWGGGVWGLGVFVWCVFGGGVVSARGRRAWGWRNVEESDWRGHERLRKTRAGPEQL